MQFFSYLGYFLVRFCTKLCSVKKGDKFESTFWFNKKFGNCCNSFTSILPILWLMTSPIFFEKRWRHHLWTAPGLAWNNEKKNVGHNTYIICMYVPGKLMTDLQMSFCVKSRQSWHNDKKLRSFAVSCEAECPFQHNVWCHFFLKVRKPCLVYTKTQ